MLDVVFLLTTLALFALVGLIVKGVEKMGPRSGGSARHEVTSGGDRGR